MKFIIGVVAILCLQHKVYSQKIDIVPFHIGDRVADLPLKNIINYKDSAATLSSFGHKLIIIDFWHTRCGTCIAMFPREDSLQRKYKDRLQFLLVTAENENAPREFLKNWNGKHANPLSMPVIAGDILLNKMFAHTYNPHFVWLAPDGSLLAQTGEELINATVISQMLENLASHEAYLKNKTFLPPKFFKYPPLTEVQKLFIQQYQN